MYTSLEALLHDAYWADEETPEAAWLEKLLTEYSGPSIEIGCGSGRLLLPLIAKGFEIEGVDNSVSMLELCKERADQTGMDVTLHHADMSSFKPDRKYKSALVPAFSLQLSDQPEAALANLHNLLEPDGILYLTVFIPFAELEGELPENEWYEDHTTRLDDGRTATLHTRHTIDRKNRILYRDHHYRLFDGGEVTEHHSQQTVRWFTARQMAKMLKNANFEVLNAMADFDEDMPVDEDSQIMTIIAKAQTEG